MVEIYTVNKIMSLYNKPRTQEKMYSEENTYKT